MPLGKETEAGMEWQEPRTLQHRGQLPGQVVGVLNAGVHAEAASRREAVRRIPRQKDPTLQWTEPSQTLSQSQIWNVRVSCSSAMCFSSSLSALWARSPPAAADVATQSRCGRRHHIAGVKAA